MSHDHHDHEHGDDHGHSHDEKPNPLGDLPVIPKPRRTHTSKVPSKPAIIEDAGAQALSDALESSFRYVKWVFLILVVGAVAFCFRQVKPSEVGVVLRFGKPLGVGKDQIKQPGLVFVLPYPIDELVRIPVAGTQTIDAKVGWQGLSAENELSEEMRDAPAEVQTLRPGADGYTLTGDGNILHVRAKVNYTIDDPVAYTFDYANVTNLLGNIVNNAVLYASAKFSAADALYQNKIAFQEAVRERLEHKTRIANQVGIKVNLVSVDTKVPLAVQASFNAVQEAVENRNRVINDARGYADETTNRAEGDAQTILNRGMSRSNQVVRAVMADARSFLDQLPHYQRDPELFTDRLLAQTMERVLTNAQDKFFFPTKPDGQSRELRININREPEAPKLKRYQDQPPQQ
jgi:modulator of FtsH protease HflK